MFFNPFDLRGPQFLGFYITLGILLFIILRIIRQRVEDDGIESRHIFTDPYMIAYLREGSQEVIRVAVISLLDRGLLTADGSMLSAKADAEAIARKPVEKGILKRCQNPISAPLLVLDPELLAMCERYEEELIKLRLLPDEAAVKMRGILFRLSLLILWGTAGMKIYVALMRGRTNIIFLIVLSVIFPLIAYALTKGAFRSIKGDRALSRLREAFSALKERAASVQMGGGTTDVVILAAVFGLLHLPGALSAQAMSLFPQLQRTSSSGGSSCSSGCSSSSCGGGGCGGGCGGCG